MTDTMICFLVFAIKYVLFAILYFVPMSDGHWTSWPHISTRRLVSKKQISIYAHREGRNFLFLGHQVVLLGFPWATRHSHGASALRGYNGAITGLYNIHCLFNECYNLPFELIHFLMISVLDN